MFRSPFCLGLSRACGELAGLLFTISPKDVVVKRILFNEIPPRAVRESLGKSDALDIDKVNAQQARRVLDRLVGYEISPLLWRVIHAGLSAGRVQSVALRLICERDAEIAKFEPQGATVFFDEIERTLPRSKVLHDCAVVRGLAERGVAMMYADIGSLPWVEIDFQEELNFARTLAEREEQAWRS